LVYASNLGGNDSGCDVEISLQACRKVRRSLNNYRLHGATSCSPATSSSIGQLLAGASLPVARDQIGDEIRDVRTQTRSFGDVRGLSAWRLITTMHGRGGTWHGALIRLQHRRRAVWHSPFSYFLGCLLRATERYITVKAASNTAPKMKIKVVTIARLFPTRR
jgi:hypothetical protein